MNTLQIRTDAEATANNAKLANRLAKQFEGALRGDEIEIEIIPGCTLPAAAAARFIEIAQADEDLASDGDLEFNLAYYVRTAILDWIDSKAAPAPRFKL